MPSDGSTIYRWRKGERGTYTVAVVAPLAMWERGDLEWDVYVLNWLVSRNAPAELFDE